MLKNKKIIIIVLIIIVLIVIGGYLLFNNKFKHSTTKQNENTEKEEKKSNIGFTITNEKGYDLKNMFKFEDKSWAYLIHDNNNETTNFNAILLDFVETENKIYMSFYDKDKFLNRCGEIKKSITSFKIDETEYTLKIQSEQEISLEKADNEKKTLKLVRKGIQNNDNAVLVYSDIIKRLNSNSEFSDEEIAKILGFYISYFNIELTNQEALLPEVGTVVAISKNRINELLSEAICSKKYIIKDYNNLKKVDPNIYDSLKSVKNNKYTGSKEEFSNMYTVNIMPSNIDGSGSRVIYQEQVNNSNVIQDVYYKVNYSRPNTLTKIVINYENNNGYKCLNY